MAENSIINNILLQESNEPAAGNSTSVASITNAGGVTTYYDSLGDAVAAVQDGQTIQILVNDIAMPDSIKNTEKKFTIQGVAPVAGELQTKVSSWMTRDHNYSWLGGITFKDIDFGVNFTDVSIGDFNTESSDLILTLDNCAFTGDGDAVNQIWGPGKLVINNCKFQQKGSYGLHAESGNGLTIEASNTSFRGKLNGYADNGATFTNCTFDGGLDTTEGSTAYTAEIKFRANCTFTNCTFTEKFAAGFTSSTNKDDNGINILLGFIYEFNNCNIENSAASVSTLVGLTLGTAVIDGTKNSGGKYTAGTFVAGSISNLNELLADPITNINTLIGRVEYTIDASGNKSLTASGWTNSAAVYKSILYGTLTIPEGMKFAVDDLTTIVTGTVIRLATIQGSDEYNEFVASLEEGQAANCTVQGWVASIESTKYYSLTEALSAATTGQTVKQLADLAETTFTVNDGITLDTNDKKLTTTDGWTIAAGAVVKTNSIINGTDMSAITSLGTVNGSVYASGGTLDLRGVDLRLKGTPALYGGTVENPTTLDTLKAARVFFGDTDSGSGDQTIKNIVLENCTTAYRAALGVYHDTLTVDTVSVNAAEGWYWDQQYQNYNYQMYTGYGGTLNINKSLTTGEYMNAGYSIGKTGITNLAEGAAINCLDFQNTGDVTTETKAAGTVHVNGAGGTLNAAALNNHAITSFGTVNLTSHPVHSTSTGGLFSVNYGTDAELTIGTLNFLNKTGDTTKSQMRFGDNAVTTIGGLTSNSAVGADLYVTQTSETTINKDGGNAVQFTGDIVFTTYADAGSDGSKVTLNLDSSDDYFTGAVKGTVSAGNRWGKWGSAVMGDETVSTDHIAGMTLNISNGATWNMTGDSAVNTLTVSDSTISGTSAALQIQSSGNFNFDYTSNISVGSVTNNGTITVDMTGAADGVYKLIDVNAASSFGTVNLTGTGAESYVTVIFENDLYAVKTNNITVTADSDSKTYDGTALTAAGYTYTGSLVQGDVLSVKMTDDSTITDVGTQANKVETCKVMRGSVDVTALYTFNTSVDGLLEVTPRGLTVVGTAVDGKTYDGTTTAKIGTIGTLSGTVTGDDVTINTATGSFADKDAGNGKDVTVQYTLAGTKASNYTVADSMTIADIEKRDVTLTSASDEKVYDGTPLTNDTITVSGSGWVDGEGATYNVTGSQTNVGSSANTFTYTLTDGTKADNYLVTTQEGTLTVTPSTGNCICNYNRTSRSDIVQIMGSQVYVIYDSGSSYVRTPDPVNDVKGWTVAEFRRDLTGDTLSDMQMTKDAGDGTTWVSMLRNDYDGDIKLNYQFTGAYDNKLWRYLGTADCNGDGKAEVLMEQTQAGADHGLRHIAAWVTDGEGKWTGNDWIGSFSNDTVAVAGTADVDGNGTDNVILRRADGMIGYWREAGTNDVVKIWESEGSVMINSADFDGDNADDLLFTNAYGDFFTWCNISGELSDVKIGNIADLGGTWNYVGAGDYNGDGIDELLWCDGTNIAYGEANKENFSKLTTIA